MSLNVLSLFAGIGGLELGLERAGMTVVGQVEIDDYCRRVLAKHWPEVPRHDDVRTTAEWWLSPKVQCGDCGGLGINSSDYVVIDACCTCGGRGRWIDRPRVDVICGGYPCQPFSTAGKMRASEDPRHLWPAFADTLRVLRPRYALIENVPAHLGLGLDRVLADLAALGFDAEWSIVPASAVAASQRRPRLFVLAYSQVAERRGRGRVSDVARGRWPGSEVADAHRCRTHSGGPADAVSWPAEPDVGRVADGPASRVDRPRLYALGNAVVPQVAEYVGHLIVNHAGQVAA